MQLSFGEIAEKASCLKLSVVKIPFLYILFFEVLIILRVTPRAAPSEAMLKEEAVADVAMLNLVSKFFGAISVG